MHIGASELTQHPTDAGGHRGNGMIQGVAQGLSFIRHSCLATAHRRNGMALRAYSLSGMHACTLHCKCAPSGARHREEVTSDYLHMRSTLSVVHITMHACPELAHLGCQGGRARCADFKRVTWDAGSARRTAFMPLGLPVARCHHGRHHPPALG